MSPAPVQLRARNAAATRAALLAAARSRFAELGYDATSLRDIAADAGVDAALVSRYFGGKDELFAEALAACDDKSWLEGGAEGLGERMSRLIMEEACNDTEGLMILMRSIGSPKAREAVIRWSEDGFLLPLAGLLEGEDTRVRARAAGSVVLGVMLSRALFCTGDMGDEERERMRERLARVLQACLSA